MDKFEQWFQTHIATGAIARNTPAYNQVFYAKQDLLDRLKVEGAAVLEIVAQWFQERIFTGELSRDAEASAQASDARDVLMATLAPASVAAPPKAPQQTQTKE